LSIIQARTGLPSCTILRERVSASSCLVGSEKFATF
jgi:hypothetical protein